MLYLLFEIFYLNIWVWSYCCLKSQIKMQVVIWLIFLKLEFLRMVTLLSFLINLLKTTPSVGQLQPLYLTIHTLWLTACSLHRRLSSTSRKVGFAKYSVLKCPIFKLTYQHVILKPFLPYPASQYTSPAPRSLIYCTEPASTSGLDV